MISWTPAALVFYQRFCCVNHFQKRSKRPPLPNTAESLPNAAVVAIAATGRVNCPSHLKDSCRKICCDSTICEHLPTSLTVAGGRSHSRTRGGGIVASEQQHSWGCCCLPRVLSSTNCDIQCCFCCCMHSCCYSWLTGRQKRLVLLFLSGSSVKQIYTVTDIYYNSMFYDILAFLL